MNLDIAYREMGGTEAIKNHIEQRAAKLDKFLEVDERVRVVVGTDAHGKIHFAEVYWHDNVNKKDFFARKEGDHLYTQIDEVFDIIQGQIQKQHDKFVTARQKTPLKKSSRI